MDKAEYNKCSNDAEVLNTRCNLGTKTETVDKYHGSGIVFLIIAIKPKYVSSLIQDTRIQRANLIINVCEYCKINVFESNMVQRHESLGRIYSFGYQGVFKQVGDISVGLYGIRQRFKGKRQMDVENIASTVENMIGNGMISASSSVNKVIAHADKLILQVLDVANGIQTFQGDIFMKKAKDKYSAMWHTNVYVNTSTGKFHTENDCSYILTTVPQQNIKAQKCHGYQYQFLFLLNNDIVIALPLTPYLTFLFSGTILTNRQKGND